MQVQIRHIHAPSGRALFSRLTCQLIFISDGEFIARPNANDRWQAAGIGTELTLPIGRSVSDQSKFDSVILTYYFWLVSEEPHLLTMRS